MLSERSIIWANPPHLVRKLCLILTKLIESIKRKAQNGESGYRSQYLLHAKRALYHLSYYPHFMSKLCLILTPKKVIESIKRTAQLENPSVDPGTSRIPGECFTIWVTMLNSQTKKLKKKSSKRKMENPGIDPGTSRMLSERSTIWANPPTRNYLIFYSFHLSAVILPHRTLSPVTLISWYVWHLQNVWLSWLSQHSGNHNNAV